MVKNIFIVGMGGMIGSMARYVAFILFGSTTFPYSTLIINVIGSLLIGCITGYALRNMAFAEWRLFLATGICGGFTTFSAFSIECVYLLQQNRTIAAITYACTSVLLGVVAAFAGYHFTK